MCFSRQPASNTGSWGTEVTQVYVSVTSPNSKHPDSTPEREKLASWHWRPMPSRKKKETETQQPPPAAGNSTQLLSVMM
jgi:hypothetical protein